ncbi:hypothetical protein ACEPPN_000679 [Leptodophora sp. 'Broadleaf-Isolate-01']
MAVVPEYEYQDLLHTDSIRILQLQPSKTHHGDLHIELIEVKLGEFLEYEAISYVWGEPVFDHQLRTPLGSIKITRNLDTALRGLRSENVVRNLWTDAVCINQMSMDEKAQQIPLMGGIYKFANCVLAWLGEGGEEIPKGFTGCKGLLKAAKEFHVGPDDSDHQYLRPPQLKVPPPSSSSSSGSEPKTLNAASISPEDMQRLESTFQSLLNSGLSSIVALPWFSRLWIIQEIVVSQRAALHYGGDKLDWDDFQTIIRLLMAILHLGTDCGWTSMELGKFPNKSELSRAIDIIQLRREYKVMTDPGAFAQSLYRQFGNNLMRARRHNCSDDRDRVYALLSLLGRGAEINIPGRHGIHVTPDYRKTVGEVYTGFALQYMPSGGYADLRILHDAGLWCRALDDSETQPWEKDYVPTWAPEHRPAKLNDYQLPWNNDAFSCTGDIIQQVKHLPNQFPNHDKFVGLEIALVDRVETLIVQADESAARDGTLAMRDLASLPRVGMVQDSGEMIPMALGQLEAFNLVPGGKYKATGEDIRVALLRTLLANCSNPDVWECMTDRFDVRDSTAVLARFAEFEQHYAQEGSELRTLFKQSEYDLTKLSNGALNVFTMLLAIAGVLSQTKFAITTTGMLALLPKMAAQYDYIVRVGGANVPFVVKKGPEGFENFKLYELVGPCYVHGVMYNEAPYMQQEKGTMWFV